LGDFALYSNSSGTSNTAVGYNAQYSNSTGTGNTAVGNAALYSSAAGGAQNTAEGDSALYNNTGNANTGIGVLALYTNTAGQQNTAIGFRSLFSNNGSGTTSGWYNTAVGAFALFSNNSSVTNTQNTAIGDSALYSNIGGYNNTADGYAALRKNTTASQNTALGYEALYYQAYNNGGTTYNTNNIAIGYKTLFVNNPTTSKNGMDNSAVGDYALYGNITGDSNTAVGYQALYNNTTGSTNTAIGYNAGPSTGALVNATAIGNGVTVTVSNSIEIGNASATFCGINGATNTTYALQVGTAAANGNGAYCTIGGVWTNASDRNRKENFSIPDGEEVLNKVCNLPIFRWNYKSESASVQHIGPIAQDFYRIFYTGKDSLSISTIDPAGVALVAVKELNNKLEHQGKLLKRKISTLQEQNDTLKEQDNALQQQLIDRMNIQEQDENKIAELKKILNSMQQQVSRK